MDVVDTINNANSILPAGDVRIGPYDYNIYSNSQLPNVKQMNDVPLKAIGNNVLRFGDIGHAVDGSALQYNIVRVDGQKSVYLPILRQGGNSNTIQIVNGVRDRVKSLLDIPKSLVTKVVFDQSEYVKIAVANVLREGTHRPGFDRADDPGISGFIARNDFSTAVDPYLLPGSFSPVECFRQFN